MKFTYVCLNAIPSRTADSIQTMKMAQAMTQEGHSVEVVAPRGSAEPSLIGVDLQRHYGLTSRFPVMFLPHPGRHGRHLYRVLAALYARRRRGAIVYSPCLPAAMLTARMGLPTILEQHEMIETRAQHAYVRWLVGSRFSRGMVVGSSSLRRAFIERFGHVLEEWPVVVAPNGVDLEHFDEAPTREQAKSMAGLDHRRLVAGYLGHLRAGRGIELIMGLARTLPHVDFLFVGGDPEGVTEWRSEAERGGLSNVRFVGFVPNPELPRYYAACDVLLMPYQRRVEIRGGADSARWMSPMKLFEYMAAGRLIVASDLPVLREVLDDTNAALCDPEDVDSWRRALGRAAADTPWCDRLANKARQDVQKYTWRRRVRRILETLL